MTITFVPICNRIGIFYPSFPLNNCSQYDGNNQICNHPANPKYTEKESNFHSDLNNACVGPPGWVT